MDGVTGIYGSSKNLVYDIWLATTAIQNRGKTASGIAVGGSNGISIHKRLGTTSDLVSEEVFNAFNKLNPIAAIGNVGYAKKKHAQRAEAEPLKVFPKQEKDIKYEVALTLDGYLVDKENILKELVDDYKFKTDNITEIIGALFHKYLTETNDEFEAGKKLVDKLHGRATFAITGLIYDGKKTKLFSINDDRAFEPFGYDDVAADRINKGLDDMLIISSESVSCRKFNKNFKDFDGAEMLVVSENGTEVRRLREEKLMRDLFVPVYFAITVSKFCGKSVTKIRHDLGMYAVEYYNSIEKPSKAEIVAPNVDSGIGVSEGLAKALELELRRAFIKTPEAPRTFSIEDEFLRNIYVISKFLVDESKLEGINYIATGDDSIVKASISEGVEGVGMPLTGGAVNVLKIANKNMYTEFWVSYPPIYFPSFKEWHRIPTSQHECITELGVYKSFKEEDMSLYDILSQPFGKSLEEINKAMAKRLNVNDVRYNTITNLKKAVGEKIFDGGCLMAVDGVYPIATEYVPDIIKKQQDLAAKNGIAPELYH